MMDDVEINKSATVRRCLERIDEEFQGQFKNLNDFKTEDSIVLNLLRACEAVIDLAMHRIAQGKLGIPQNSRDAFELLLQGGILTPDVALSMKNMVGFRNLAVHNYQKLQRPVLESILMNHLGDFETFLTQIKTSPQPRPASYFP